jgi:cobalt-zinc-cadmium resistance protein CzcA
MFERIIQSAIVHRWLVMLAVLAMAAIGVYSYQKLPIDAVPDITNVQVQINTSASGYSPLEVEQRVTFPIETVMAGLPNLEQTRSLSRYGLSQVTVIFKDGTDIYFARQLVNQRIQEAKENLPQGVVPMMGQSLPAWERSTWTVESEPNAKSLTVRLTLQLICARSRIGSSSHNCARWKASLRSIRSVAMPRNITLLLTL